MTRTALARQLVSLCARAAHATGAPHSAATLSRREFLRATARAGVATLAGGALAGRAAAATGAKPRIAIVGAGLAGLTCAWQLKNRYGLHATVYEAAAELGGRCRTRRGAFDDGQIAERGGEFIDTGHTAIRHLAHHMGLALDDVHAAEIPGSEPFYRFDGARYSGEDVLADFKTVLPKLTADIQAADYPTLYNHSTTRGAELDQMSIDDWIDESVPGGLASRFGQLLQVAYTIEYGAECSGQSALNLLYLFGYSRRNQLQLFGPSDERFHIRGGNDRLVKKLADQLTGRIQTGKTLTAIAREMDGTWTLTFGSDPTVTADRVVLALPFSILRGFDYSAAGFSALKQTAIQNLGMGTNTKLHVQFTRRLWRGLGSNGDSYADTGYQNTWDASRTQEGKSGLLVNYTGGNVSAGFATGTPEAHAQTFLAELEPVFPGASAVWNGKATVEYWSGNPLTKGAYSYWKVGQYTQFAGIERVAENGCHFAGEHTSIDYQGFLNGAVSSGNRAAREVHLAAAQP